MPTVSPSFSAAQSQYLIDRLLRDRLVTASTLNRLVKDMETEVADLERRLALLKGAVSAEPRSANRAHRKQGKVSPAVAASRRLQGQYLGLIRQFPAARRGAFKKIAAEKGREQAVRALRAALADRG